MRAFIVTLVASCAAAVEIMEGAGIDIADLVAAVNDPNFGQEPEPVEEDAYTGRSEGWETWIGKYKYDGATDEWLEAMYDADTNKDGTVTLSEAIDAAEDIGAEVDDWIVDMAETQPDDYRWDQDLALVTELLPMGFDHDGDGELNYEETQDFFAAIDQEELGEAVFIENATIDADDMEGVLDDWMNEDGLVRPG